VNVDAIIREVETIRSLFPPLLSDSHKRVLGAALSSLNDQKERHGRLKKKASKPPWKLIISPDDPLAFRSTDDDGTVKHNLDVDLACTLSEPNDSGVPQGAHNIAVRVWSTNSSQCFREEYDAECLRDPIEQAGRRVMLKFHFDLANEDQEGPRHHLQIGGKAHAGDLHWLPDNWKLPRFAHVPVNLVLVCEFIGRTFHPNQFKKIAQDASWIHAVKEAEQAYVVPYLDSLPYVKLDSKKRKDSLFASVWNV
jgi:hypothetical protein